MARNPNHRSIPQAYHSGKTIRIQDAPGYKLREEDYSWILSGGGKIAVDEHGDVTITYRSRKAAHTAFGGMMHEGKANVDSVEDMTFIGEDSVELAEMLQGLD